MSQLPILVPASKLTKSPTNMRWTSDPAADAQLEANIAERGVLQNLVGIPVARKKGHYRITAGGRRLDAVHRLIAAGKLAADHPVPVLVLGDASDAIEISLSENFFRLAMNPAEACRAFQDIIDIERKSPAEVALRFGLSERFVLGRLRLASLAEPIFDALSAGDITLDVAMAYASVSDFDMSVASQERPRQPLSGSALRYSVRHRGSDDIGAPLPSGLLLNLRPSPRGARNRPWTGRSACKAGAPAVSA